MLFTAECNLYSWHLLHICLCQREGSLLYGSLIFCHFPVSRAFWFFLTRFMSPRGRWRILDHLNLGHINKMQLIDWLKQNMKLSKNWRLLLTNQLNDQIILPSWHKCWHKAIVLKTFMIACNIDNHLDHYLHAAWKSPASEVITPRTPDAVVRIRHPVIVTFTHKKWVLHLLVWTIIIWKCSSTVSTKSCCCFF